MSIDTTTCPHSEITWTKFKTEFDKLWLILVAVMEAVFVVNENRIICKKYSNSFRIN
jgi:hypothetical protein